jgi:hypothetical protein
MTNQELYKQAILDAKAVRETAMAAAKESLAEAFEPRIKEMLRLKLSEEMEESVDMEETVDMEEAFKLGDTPPFKDNKGTEKGAPYGRGKKNEPGDSAYQTKVDLKKTSGSLSEDEMEESTLEEILAELDALSEDDDTMEEAKMDKMEEGLYEAGDEEEAAEDDEDAEEAPEMGEEASDDEQVVELTVGELKDIFRDVFAQAQGGATPEMDGTLDEPTDKPEELSLEEILAELEEEENKMEENINVGAEIAHKRTPGKYGGGEYKVDEAKKKMDEKMKKDLEEANKAVNAMRAELQEVNLLNAKLLYVNKIWKGKSLSESQKVKVLNAFDRATTVKEAENIFKTLNESLVAPKKTDLKESMGFASKPIGSAPAKPIVEIDSMVARWQTIAGIK